MSRLVKILERIRKWNHDWLDWGYPTELNGGDSFQLSRGTGNTRLAVELVSFVTQQGQGESMKVFDIELPCQKCGQKDISNRFIQKGDYEDYRKMASGRIKRYCRTCQFEWFEKPLDDVDHVKAVTA